MMIQRREIDAQMIEGRRLELGLSLEAIARRLRCGTTTVHSWTVGKHRPHPRMIPRLARLLKCHPRALFLP